MWVGYLGGFAASPEGRVEVPCWFWAHSSLVNMYTSYHRSKIFWKNVYFGNMVVEKDTNHGLVNFDFLLACLII